MFRARSLFALKHRKDTSPQRAVLAVESLETRTLLSGGAINPEVVTINATSPVVVEGDAGSREVRVLLTPSGGKSQPYSLEYYTYDGTAKAGGDYESKVGIVSWNANDTSTRTVSFKISGDRKFEPSEYFNVRLRIPNSIYGHLINGGKISIANDDPRPSITVSNASGLEGGSIRFAVTLSNPSYQSVSVSFETINDTATLNDYDFQRGIITWQPGQGGTKWVTIRTRSDTVDENDESFFLKLTGPVNADLANTFAIGSIVDDDAGGGGGGGNPPPPPTAPYEIAGPVSFQDGVWYIDTNGDGDYDRKVWFGAAGDAPFVGDFNGDGKANLAVARYNRARGGLDWYFDLDRQGAWSEKLIYYGLRGDTPVVGDWDGDGTHDLGVVRYNPWRGGLDWYLDLDNQGGFAEHIVPYGLLGDTPVVGDWDGDGKDDLGVVRYNPWRGGLDWYLDLAGDGHFAERIVQYGLYGDVPVVGDWDGDGKSDFGVVRNGNQWYLDLLGDGYLAEHIFTTQKLGNQFLFGRW